MQPPRGNIYNDSLFSRRGDVAPDRRSPLHHLDWLPCIIGGFVSVSFIALGVFPL